MRRKNAAYLRHFYADELVIASTRYYLGRMSIAVGGFTRELCAAWPEMPEVTRTVIRESVDEAFRQDNAAREKGEKYLPLGHDCDRESWEQVRALWTESDMSPPCPACEPIRRVIEHAARSKRRKGSL